RCLSFDDPDDKQPRRAETLEYPDFARAFHDRGVHREQYDERTDDDRQRDDDVQKDFDCPEALRIQCRNLIGRHYAQARVVGFYLVGDLLYELRTLAFDAYERTVLGAAHQVLQGPKRDLDPRELRRLVDPDYGEVLSELGDFAAHFYGKTLLVLVGLGVEMVYD